MTPAARDRLSRAVRARRQALRLTVVEAAQRAEIARMTWDAMEKGTRDLRDANYAAVETTLGWQPGSVVAVLEGGNPRLADLTDVDLPDPDRYLDPETGEDYTDPDEQAIWGLSQFSQHDRRRLIYYLRTERSLAAAKHRRQAG
jgi:hypothetical protein